MVARFGHIYYNYQSCFATCNTSALLSSLWKKGRDRAHFGAAYYGSRCVCPS